MTRPRSTVDDRFSHSNGKSALGALLSTLSIMSPSRRLQLAITVTLMLAGGAAEVVSIGSVVPVLAYLTDTAAVARFPLVSDLMSVLTGADAASSVVPAVIFLIATAIAAAAIRLALSWFSIQFVVTLGHEIGTLIFRTMLSRPYEVHISRNSSQIVSAVEKVQVVVFGVLYPLFQGLVAFVIASCIVAFLLAFDPAVAAVAIGVMGLLYVAISLVSAAILKRNSTVLAAMQTSRIRRIQEAVGAIRDIIIARSDRFFYEGFRADDRAFRRAQGVNAFTQVAPRFVVEGTGIVLIAAYALYVSEQPGGLAAAVPVIGAMALGAQRLLPLLQQIYQGWSALQGASQVLVDVENLIEAQHTRALPKPQEPLAFARTIELDRVSFRYANGVPVLSNVSLTIEKGQKIGVVGKTGSGKSTLVDIIMGLLQPTEGCILIDGVPLSEANRYSWYAKIAHVPQSVYLADTTIGANIAFGSPSDGVDMERVKRAAEMAQIAADIEALPDSYATAIGERGARLSGGQRQRLGLARAFFREAPVLVFDEATSALDTETEARAMAALNRLDESVTVVMISHRRSTLRICDAIITVECGAARLASSQPIESVGVS